MLSEIYNSKNLILFLLFIKNKTLILKVANLRHFVIFVFMLIIMLLYGLIKENVAADVRSYNYQTHILVGSLCRLITNISYFHKQTKH